MSVESQASGGRNGADAPAAEVPLEGAPAPWQRYRPAPATAEGAYETDLAGRITWASPTMAAVLGWAPEQLVGMSGSDLVHPLDAERMATLRTDIRETGRAHDAISCMVRTATGTYRSVTMWARPRLDDSGEMTGLSVTVRDAHDRDAALRALTTLSQANRTLVHSTDEQSLLQRMCDTIVTSGRYLLAWYGRPLEDAGQTVTPVARAGAEQHYVDEIHVSWADNELGRGPSGRAVRTRQPQVLNDFAESVDYAPWYETARRHGFQSSLSLPVIVDDQLDGVLMVYAGEVGAFDALAQELLEDLVADLGYGLGRLRAVSRVQSILDSMIDPLTIMEAVRDAVGALVDLRWTEANDAAIEYNGLPREQLIGARLLELFPGQLEHGPLRHYFHTIETGEPTVLDDYTYGNEQLAESRQYDIRATKCGDGIALTWRDVTDRHRAAQTLAESEHRYRLLAENSSDVIFLADDETVLLWASEAAEPTLGWPPDQLVGRRATDFIHPDDVATLQVDIERSRRSGTTITPHYRWRRPDGTYRWMEAAGRPFLDEEGRPRRVVRLRDIDDQVRAELELVAREERYRVLAENASDVVWQVDPGGRLTWTSPSVVRVLGWQPDDLVGRMKLDLIDPADRDRARRERDEVIEGRAIEDEVRILRPDGTSRWMAMAIHPVPTHAGMSRIVSLRDIEDEVRARTELEFALGHDQLTGLARRDVILNRVDYVRTQLPAHRSLAVLCVGIDALGEVNEAYGHAAGDTILTAVAARIVEAVANPDAVGRGSGDELLVIQSDLVSGADAAELAERIRQCVQFPVTAAGQSLIPTVSIGIATGDADSTAELLLRDASLAMRKAKNLGRDQSTFADPTLSEEAEHRIGVESAIRNALAAGAFTPWFQPIVELAHGTIVGYEALARWVHAEGVHLPDDFIAIAARSSLITEIDLAMLDPVVSALNRLPENTFVGLNVTGQTLARTPYAELVIDALGRAGVDPHRLHLEVTETMLLALDEDIISKMRTLAERGCSWYVDDFGTGYSSISHLRDLPVRGLKLDKSFTDGIAEGDETSRQLADALVGLANGLDLDTVAEGVETEAQARYLRTLGWRHGQGWLYGKAAPLP